MKNNFGKCVHIKINLYTILKLLRLISLQYKSRTPERNLPWVIGQNPGDGANPKCLGSVTLVIIVRVV